jgi:hypothetical protein
MQTNTGVLADTRISEVVPAFNFAAIYVYATLRKHQPNGEQALGHVSPYAASRTVPPAVR